MNVVDSSAWLSWFAGDGNAALFAEAIEDTVKLLIPTVTITEVFRHVMRHRDEESALMAVAQMHQGKVIVLDAGLAADAASYGIQYRLPLADSIIYATARRYRATVWTQDSDFRDLPYVRFHARRP